MLNKIDNPVIVASCQSVGKEGKFKLIRNYHLCHKTHSITSVIVTVMFIFQKLKVSFSIYIRFLFCQMHLYKQKAVAATVDLQRQ
mgnify:CR=1 FL=1